MGLCYLSDSVKISNFVANLDIICFIDKNNGLSANEKY